MKRTTIMTIAMALLIGSSSSAQPPTPSVDDVIRGLSAGYEKLIVHGWKRNVSHKMSTINEATPANKIAQETTFTRRNLGDEFFLVEVKGATPAECQILCTNSQYAFLLGKADNPSQWIIKKCVLHKDIVADADSAEVTVSNEQKISSRDHYMSAVRIPLHRILEGSKSSITIRGVDGENDAITVSYSYSGPMNSYADKPIPGISTKLTGWAKISMKNNWAIIEQEEEFSIGPMVSKQRSSNTINTDSNYTKLMGRTMTSENSSAGKLVNKIVVNQEHIDEPVVTDESLFRLTHYGLPEPEGVVWKKPIPLYVWLLIGAGGFALIALVCRWLLRRRSAKSVPVVPPPAA